MTKIERGMLIWFVHVERMNVGRLTAQIYGANVDKGKEKGLPEKGSGQHIYTEVYLCVNILGRLGMSLKMPSQKD